MSGVLGFVVLEGDRVGRFPGVEDEAALVRGQDATGKEGEPRHGVQARLVRAPVCQVIGPGFELGEEGGRAGVVLSRQPYLLDLRL